MTKANKTPQEGIESEARHFDWIVAMTLDYCPSLISENLGFSNLIKRHIRYTPRRYHKTNSIVNPMMIDSEIVKSYQNERSVIELVNSGILTVENKNGRAYVQNHGYVISMMAQLKQTQLIYNYAMCCPVDIDIVFLLVDKFSIDTLKRTIFQRNKKLSIYQGPDFKKIIQESFDEKMAAEIIEAAATSKRYEKRPSRYNSEERGSSNSKRQRNF